MLWCVCVCGLRPNLDDGTSETAVAVPNGSGLHGLLDVCTKQYPNSTGTGAAIFSPDRVPDDTLIWTHSIVTMTTRVHMSGYTTNALDGAE